jgi:hypothetical protein
MAARAPRNVGPWRAIHGLRLIDTFDFEIAAVSTRQTAELAREPGYQALLTLPGVGPVLAG